MTITESSEKAAVKIDFPALETLTFEVLGGEIGVLRINRPDRMNSQTVKMFSEYGEAAFALRDTALRALILTATGERAFCAGFDLATGGFTAEAHREVRNQENRRISLIDLQTFYDLWMCPFTGGVGLRVRVTGRRELGGRFLRV